MILEKNHNSRIKTVRIQCEKTKGPGQENHPKQHNHTKSRLSYAKIAVQYSKE